VIAPLLALAAGAAPTPSGPDPLCPAVPELPYGWRLEWGMASGKNEASAVTDAQESARQRLLGAACQGVGALRCAAAGRSVAPWGTATFDKKRQSACAAMVIKLDALQSFEQDLARLDQDLARLAQDSASATRGAPVRLDAPTWPSGCVAGDLGHALAAQLRNELARHDVRLAAPDAVAAGGTLALTLAPGGERVTVSATLRPPASSEEKPLPGFTFPLDLYGVSPSEVGRCVGRDRLGLEHMARPGSAGLSVSVTVPTDGGRMCEGTRATASVAVSQPARLQIWSVIHDGRAFLIGPDPGLIPGGVLRPSTPAPVLQLDALALEELGDEVLVVIATPEGAPAPAAQAPCRLDRPWSAAMLPSGAAVATQTWTVVPEGTRGCGSWEGAASRAEVTALLQSLPVCR
jgi:hypothetical protein